jgi:hypothetical protein
MNSSHALDADDGADLKHKRAWPKRPNLEIVPTEARPLYLTGDVTPLNMRIRDSSSAPVILSDMTANLHKPQQGPLRGGTNCQDDPDDASAPRTPLMQQVSRNSQGAVSLAAVLRTASNPQSHKLQGHNSRWLSFLSTTTASDNVQLQSMMPCAPPTDAVRADDASSCSTPPTRSLVTHQAAECITPQQSISTENAIADSVCTPRPQSQSPELAHVHQHTQQHTVVALSQAAACSDSLSEMSLQEQTVRNAPPQFENHAQQSENDELPGAPDASIKCHTGSKDDIQTCQCQHLFASIMQLLSQVYVATSRLLLSLESLTQQPSCWISLCCDHRHLLSDGHVSSLDCIEQVDMMIRCSC